MASVLVVDDDIAVLRLVSMILRSEGLSVETATGGTVALELLSEAEPDLIVLDLSMPEMDGRTFYSLARASGYEGPVVICSAYGAQRVKNELGTQGAIEKRFDPEYLVNTVKTLLLNGNQSG